MAIISNSSLNKPNMDSCPHITGLETMLGFQAIKAKNENGFKKVDLFFSETGDVRSLSLSLMLRWVIGHATVYLY